MNHEQINTFIKVIECGSFNKAGEVLFVSPSAVMRQVNRLEEELKIKLLDRTSKGIKPTAAGAYYYQEVSRWNQEYDNIVNQTRKLERDDILKQTFRVGTSRSLPEKFMKYYWGVLRENFPHVKFEFVSYGVYFKDIMNMIYDIGEKIDIVIDIYEPWAIDAYALRVVHLYDVDPCCAISIHSELYSKEVLTIKDLFGKTVGIFDIKQSLQTRAVKEYFAKYPEITIREISTTDESIFDKGQEGSNNKRKQGIPSNVTGRHI